LNTQEEDTIFHKILRKEIPSKAVYEDEQVYAFRDINPQAPVHIIIIPKEMQGLNMLSNATSQNIPILGQLMFAATEIAKQEGLVNGYRIVVNNDRDGCKKIIYLNLGQSVNYLHLHLLGGAKFGWPPGTNY